MIYLVRSEEGYIAQITPVSVRRVDGPNGAQMFGTILEAIRAADAAYDMDGLDYWPEPYKPRPRQR